MSFGELLKQIVRLASRRRRFKQSMGQIRASSKLRDAIDPLLEAYRKGDYAAALEIAETLKGHPPLAGPYLFYCGTMLMNLGELKEAERRLRRNLTAAQDTKRLAISYSTLGELLLETRRYDEALECFETSLRHWPERGSAHRDIAETWLRRGGNTAAAVEFARLAVEEDRMAGNPTGSARARESHDINLGQDLATLAWAVAADSRDAAQVDRLIYEAVPLVQTAVRPSAQVHCHSGHAYLELGDSTKSAQHFTEAARLDPKGLWGQAARRMADQLRA